VIFRRQNSVIQLVAFNKLCQHYHCLQLNRYLLTMQQVND